MAVPFHAALKRYVLPDITINAAIKPMTTKIVTRILFKNFPKKLQKKSFLKRMMEDHKEKYTHDYPIFKQKMSYSNIKQMNHIIFIEKNHE